MLLEEAIALLQSEITSTPCVLATYLWEDAARAEAGGPGRGWDIVEYVLDAKTGKLSVKCGTYPDQFGRSRTLERELTPAEFHAKAVALEMREQLRMMQTSGDWEKVLAGESVRAMLEQHEREEAERKAAERAANCVRLPEEFRAVRPKMDIDSVELRLDQRYSSTVLQLSKLHGRYCFGKASVLQKLLDAGTIGTENLNMLNDAEAAWVEHEVRRALKSLNWKTWQSLPGGDRMSVEIVIGGRRKADLQNEKPMDKYTDLLFALRKLERYGSDTRE